MELIERFLNWIIEITDCDSFLTRLVKLGQTQGVVKELGVINCDVLIVLKRIIQMLIILSKSKEDIKGSSPILKTF